LPHPMVQTTSSALVLPSLPGYAKKTPPKPNIVKAFKIINGIRIDKTAITKTELRDGIPHSIKFGLSQDRKEMASSSQSHSHIQTHTPAHYALHRQKQDRDLYDDPREMTSKPLPFHNGCPHQAGFLTEHRTLKFNGYFIEQITESPDETTRVRHVDLYYYLLDDTMHLEEPVQVNSGIPQGQFHRRAILRHPDSHEPYTLQDLTIGATIQVAGRLVHLINCDVATRTYLQQIGHGLVPDPIPVPYEPPASSSTSCSGSDRINHGKKLTSMKYFMEASLGQNVQTKVNAHQPTNVLRFYLVWDPPGPGTSRSTYALHFYLYDQTIEIVHDKGNKEQAFSKLLSRRKMPKCHVNEIYNDADRGVEANNPVGHYYDLNDLRIGTVLNVWGRPMTIIDCDPFTRAYVQTHLHLTDDQVAPLPLLATPRPTYPRQVPPHILGIGSEEDSLASWHHLRPKKPKHDVKKLAEWDGKVLQWAAVPLNGPGVAQKRTFVVKYFLADDTVGVYDVPTKNSGLTTGCFYRRSKVKHATEDRYIDVTCGDFHVDKTIEIGKHVFQLTKADEYTKSYLAGSPMDEMVSDVPVLTGTMKFKLRQKNKSMGFLRSAFRQLDENSNATISLEELTQYLQNSCCRGSVLSPDAAVEIFQAMDTNQDGRVDFNEFCAAIGENGPPKASQGQTQACVVNMKVVTPMLQVLKACRDQDGIWFDKLVKRQIRGNTEEMNMQVTRDSVWAIHRHFKLNLNREQVSHVVEYLFPNGVGTITCDEFYGLLGHVE